jgi:hypothetical protein
MPESHANQHGAFSSEYLLFALSGQTIDVAVYNLLGCSERSMLRRITANSHCSPDETSIRSTCMAPTLAKYTLSHVSYAGHSSITGSETQPRPCHTEDPGVTAASLSPIKSRRSPTSISLPRSHSCPSVSGTYADYQRYSQLQTGYRQPMQLRQASLKWSTSIKGHSIRLVRLNEPSVVSTKLTSPARPPRLPRAHMQLHHCGY